ncbi:lysophospholipid acyltransferase family protein [soil metagenome]
MPDMPWRSMHVASRFALRKVRLRVEGLEHIPKHGPVIIAARHFHHFYDGAVLLNAIDRPLHILVALDWVRGRASQLIMPRACAAARWPVVDRNGTGMSGMRAAVRESVELLNCGRVLAIFPEAYPTIDPSPTPKTNRDEFLPFRDGVVRIAGMAATPDRPVVIVPAGFSYVQSDQWEITVRFGPPFFVTGRARDPEMIGAIEQDVIQLSMA